MSGGGGAIKGYWYSLGIHMGICRGPVNSIVETRVGDKPVLPIFLEITDSVIFPLYNPNLFGGTDGEGGIAGPINVMMGKDDQLCPPELALMNFPTPQPGFRRICSVFFDGFVAAINPYPKPWTFRVRRTTKGWDGEPWYPEKAMIELTRPYSASEITSTPIIHAMNPAHIFYEVMTNREWGRGLPRAALDDANLRAVADTLHAEGFGMCLYWSRSDDIETFIQSILDHIGAVLRPNLTTGELQLKLLRKDYVVADLPLFDNESGLLDITEASVAAMPTIINHCKVTFKDPITGKDGSVGTHNLAGVKGSNGEINTLEKSYPGLPTPDLAARVALRDLRASSNALRRFNVTLDRRGQDVQPGDVIRVRDMTRGIGEVVVRVGKYEEGNNLDGRITVSAVQDIFRMTPTSFTGNQPPTWEAPNTSPCIGYNRSFEMPYFMLAHTMSAADLDYLGDDTGFLGEVVELGGRPMNAGYKIATRIGLPTEDDLPPADENFCPTVPANWDGGDCVRIVVAEDLSWVVTPAWTTPYNNVWISPDMPVFTPVGATDPAWTGAPGPVWGFIAIGYQDDPAGDVINVLFEGDGTEGYTGLRFEYDGVETDIPLTFRPGVPGAQPTWNYESATLPFFMTSAGTYKMTLLGSGGGVKAVEACCTCLEMVISGTGVAGPGIVAPFRTDFNGTVVSPDSVVSMNAVNPSWGVVTIEIDTTVEPDEVTQVSDSSLQMQFGPADSPYLAEVLTCKVYDDSEGGALVYETVLYRAGGTEEFDTWIYLERPVANYATDIFDVYPHNHNAPFPPYPANPGKAFDGHDLRFVLGTASVCCGGLPPPDPVGTPHYRLSGMSPTDSGGAWIDGAVVPFTGVNGPWVTSLEKIAMGGTGISPFFEVALLDAEGVPLSAEFQPTWTGSTDAVDGNAYVFTNEALGNPDGVPGGSLLAFGGAPTVFNRSVTYATPGHPSLVLAVHYPNVTFTQTCIRAEVIPATPPGYVLTAATGTGNATSGQDGTLITEDFVLKVYAPAPPDGGSGTTGVGGAYFGFLATPSFAASGVDWIDDSTAFHVHDAGAGSGLNYLSLGHYINWDSGTPTGTSGPQELSTSAEAGPNQLTRFIQLTGISTGGGIVSVGYLGGPSGAMCQAEPIV